MGVVCSYSTSLGSRLRWVDSFETWSAMTGPLPLYGSRDGLIKWVHDMLSHYGTEGPIISATSVDVLPLHHSGLLLLDPVTSL
jgi:hypothetical protein